MRKLISVSVLVLVALACAQSARADPSTFLFLNSQPGDPIGGGIQQTFTPADSTFSESYDGSLLTVSVFPLAGGFWFVNLAAPPGQPLVPGTYTGAVRAAFEDPDSPVLTSSATVSAAIQTRAVSPSTRQCTARATTSRLSMPPLSSTVREGPRRCLARSPSRIHHPRLRWSWD